MKDRFAIIARDASDQIISQVSIHAPPGKQPLEGMMATARNMLRIKGCVRTEIHPLEDDASMYVGSPLVVLLVQDLFLSDVSPAPLLETL